MRAILLSALVACVSAAPSLLSPSPDAAQPAVLLGVAPLLVAPTKPLGDIQAAVIDAQVKVSDQARFLSDQAKDIVEQKIEEQNQKVLYANDLAKEKSEEAYWASEEKKYQALNEAQIAEARLASSVAEDIAANAETTEEKVEIDNEAIVIKSEEKGNIAAEIEKPSETPAVAKLDNINEAEATAQQALKTDEQLALKSTNAVLKQEDALEAYKLALARIANAKPEEALELYMSTFAPIALLKPEAAVQAFKSALAPITVPNVEEALVAYKSALARIANAKPEEALEAYTAAVTPTARANPEQFFKTFKSIYPTPIALAPGFNFQPYVASLPYQGYNSYPFQYIPAFPYHPTFNVVNKLGRADLY